jgi:hypothetical protein
MPELAEKIVVDNLSQEIWIDGVQLPWVVQKDRIAINSRSDDMPGIRVTILANQGVAVIDLEEVERFNEETNNA